jgi:hypothetical protein
MTYTRKSWKWRAAFEPPFSVGEQMNKKFSSEFLTCNMPRRILGRIDGQTT